ncbi:hypothetical protein BGZ50_003352, partial [Haplosporangium sp. Z 11]
HVLQAPSSAPFRGPSLLKSSSSVLRRPTEDDDNILLLCSNATRTVIASHSSGQSANSSLTQSTPK